MILNLTTEEIDLLINLLKKEDSTEGNIIIEKIIGARPNDRK
jgi:hypothetical protein